MNFGCRRPVAYIEFGMSIAGQEEAWKASTTITHGVTGGRSVFTGTTTPAGVESKNYPPNLNLSSSSSLV